MGFGSVGCPARLPAVTRTGCGAGTSSVSLPVCFSFRTKSLATVCRVDFLRNIYPTNCRDIYQLPPARNIISDTDTRVRHPQRRLTFPFKQLRRPQPMKSPLLCAYAVPRRYESRTASPGGYGFGRGIHTGGKSPRSPKAVSVISLDARSFGAAGLASLHLSMRRDLSGRTSHVALVELSRTN